jgi:hypothetical protein
MADNRATYLPLIQREAARAGVPWQLLDLMILQESGYNPNAVGDGGNAIGLGQLWAPAAIDGGISPSQRSDPAANARAAANYAAIAYRNAGGDWRETAARYNAGAWNNKISPTSSAWTHAANVLGRAGQYGYQIPGGGVTAQPNPAAAAVAATQAPVTSGLLGLPANYVGVDYPQMPQLAAQSPAPALAAVQIPAAARRPQMSLSEIFGYANYQPPAGFTA